MKTQKPIVFFDGICHLCNAFVDILIKQDPLEHFLFAPIQGETAQKILTPEERKNIETVILYENEKKYRQSEAVLRIFAILGGFYKIFLFGYIIPSPLRDKIYSWIAKNRYRWFGRRDFCRLPEAHEKNRLLP